MKSTVEMIGEIIKNPLLYVGSYSLERIAAFLDGYRTCFYRNVDATYEDEFTKFQGFVEDKYHISSGQKWNRIIEFYSASEKEAFDSFVRCFHKFLERSER